jgi:hypothetical protein
MTLKRYTISATSPEAWHRIHNLLTHSSCEECVPDRHVCCTNSKDHSPTRSTYELTEEEAATLATHPDIAWIELSHVDNAEVFPVPQPATIQDRFGGDKVKTYRTITSIGTSIGEVNRTNWGVYRTGFSTYGDAHPGNISGNISPSQISPDGVAYQYVYDGSNVDIVVMDSGVFAAHPEFRNDDGTSRVRDIVLDAPLLIDPTWFTVTNNYTYTRWDGVTGIATDKAIEWWEFSSQRSSQFASIGTININNGAYTADRAGMGRSSYVNLSSGHGTAAASVAAGKAFGLAFKSIIWSVPCVTGNVDLGIEEAYDLIKLFHRHKPVDPTLGVKKPTIVNSSWGYQAAARAYQSHFTRFRGSQQYLYFNYSYPTNPIDARTVVYGFTNQVSGAYRSWTSSARSAAIDAAGREMMDEGVIHVASAGNNDQRIGVGTADPSRLDACDDRWFFARDTRFEFANYGQYMCPMGSKEWMNPMGVGYTATEIVDDTDPFNPIVTGYDEFYPVVTVGALDDFVTYSGGPKERKAYYSNYGPGIDVWAPADDILAAGSPTSGYQDYYRYNSFAEYGYNHYDAYFNGTSAAAPVVAGLLACYLQRFPSADSRQVKSWLAKTLGDGGSRDTANTLWDQYPVAQYPQTNYLFHIGQYNLGGAPTTQAYLNSTSSIGSTFGGIATPEIVGVPTTGVFRAGIALTSSTYAPIGGAYESGTLKKVRFQVATDNSFNNIVYDTPTDSLLIEQDVDLSSAQTYYARVQHLSNADGTSFTAYASEFSGIVSFRTNVPAFGIVPPTILEPFEGVVLDNVTGVILRSSTFAPLNGVSASGTLKAIEFEVSEDPSFSSNVWSSVGQNNTAERQTVQATLLYGVTYYIRVRHVSNADGSSLVESTSDWSPTRTVSTLQFDNNVFGRTRNLVTSLQGGVVTPVLLFEAPELVEVTVTVSNKTNLKSNYSVGLSSSFGFLDSDYIAYGIEIVPGQATHLENIAMKPGDKIFVNSFDPGINFSAYTTKFFRNTSADSALVHGRSKSLTSSYDPPNNVNKELTILDAVENSLATVHATNRGDTPTAVSVGIASGDITSVKPSDFIVFGVRLQPLQDFKVDSIGISTGQTLFIRASRPNVSFVAYSRPADDGPSGVGTVASVNTTGIITAASFVGDGSGLTGVTAIGAGVEVRDSGSIIGAASTIDFGSQLTVSPISSGIVTVTGPDSVSLATTALNLDPSFIPERATYADYATVAGLATNATSATSALSATLATTADLAVAISTNATITVYNDITAPRFIGDGSQLTNIVAAGTGVIVNEDDSLVGTAGTINFTSPLTVTPVSAGIVTIGVSEVPRATLAGIASEAVVAGLATFASFAGVATQALNANFASVSSFSALTGAADTAKNLYTESRLPYLPLPVTFGTKSSRHRYIGVGSDSTINIQGYEAPYLRFEVGQTYRFENAAQQADFPIRFYYSPDGLGVGFGTTSPSQYSDNVTETGSYTEIVVTDTTPQLLYYGAGIGTTTGYMGNSIQVFNHDFHKVNRVGEFKNLSGLKTCTYTQMFEGRATSWYMNSNLGVGNNDYTPGDRSHNISSLVQTSTGIYTVNFADPMNDTDYAVIGIGSGINAFPGGIVELRISDRTVNGFTMRVYNSIPALEDLGELSIVTYGGQDGEPTYI